jgi:two-component system cell cycle response regulator DivK
MTKAGATDALVLVVDDFEDNRAMYVEYLQFQGFRVAEAVNGLEAIERTQALLPVVIVMDLSLPVMDGWEATRRIKADPKTKHIRVIALTGHAEPAHAKKALEAGCDDFVAKPCLPENLLAKIREHLPSSSTSSSRNSSSRDPAQRAAGAKKQKGKK